MATKHDELGHFVKGTHWREPQEFRDETWLREEYTHKGRSTKEIADQFGVGDTAILFWLHKLGIPRRSMSEVRALKYWGARDESNPMFGRMANENPNWRGGITAERQAFYAGRAWKSVCAFVWRRDSATCQRCNLRKTADRQFHVHHIVSFANRELRSEESNLVLLCVQCHRFVHSKKNEGREYLR